MHALRIMLVLKEFLGLDGCQLIRQPDNRTASYLAYHRKFIFVVS